MKTFNKILLGVMILISTEAVAQEMPSLPSSDLLQSNEVKKKSGWIKIGLDEKFQIASNPNFVKYEYYEFVNTKGQYNSTYTSNLPFPKNSTRVEYGSSQKLLNGTISFYDKDKLVLQYVFKDGFYIKAADWKNQSSPSTLIEYIPKKKSVELYANYFDSNGKIKSFSHEENDGLSYKTLPSQKNVTPISN